MSKILKVNMTTMPQKNINYFLNASLEWRSTITETCSRGAQ